MIRDLQRGRQKPLAATRDALTAAVVDCLNHPPDASTLKALQTAREVKRSGTPHNDRAPRRRWKLRRLVYRGFRNDTSLRSGSFSRPSGTRFVQNPAR